MVGKEKSTFVRATMTGVDDAMLGGRLVCDGRRDFPTLSHTLTREPKDWSSGHNEDHSWVIRSSIEDASSLSEVIADQFSLGRAVGFVERRLSLILAQTIRWSEPIGSDVEYA